MAEGLKKRQAAKALTASRISDAAKPLFEARGYDAVSIRAVAKASGYSTGAIFNCFIDKADLWRRTMFRDVPSAPDFIRMVARLTTPAVGPDGDVDDPITTLESLIERAIQLDRDLRGSGPA
jgi:AcrR family transcriptional regulator